MKEFYTENRKKFGELMENNSFLVIFAGQAPLERGDRFYSFSPQRNLFYLTGIDKPAVAFMLKKNHKGELHERLYVERFDETFAKWEGAPINGDKAKEVSGVENIAFLDELDKHISSALVRERLNVVYLDLETRGLHVPNTPDIDFAGRLREKFPAVTIINAHPILGGLRLCKTDTEVTMMQKAADVTGLGFMAFLDNVRPGMFEYELEAHWDYIVRKSGLKRSFDTIMASGANGTVLHYHDNNAEIKDGDLVLTDFGAQYGWYCADLSRTFPANGKFTPRQRELYNIVLGAMKKVFAIIKPGVKFAELNQTVKDYYKEELTRIGLIKDENEIANYYYHGVSHMIGLEVHDVGAGSTSTDGELYLKAGMVISVEPGLYIAEEGIGIRIEDDVLVTEDGYMNLTEAFIKEPDEIEAYMARRYEL